jgi:hypothetical protein
LGSFPEDSDSDSEPEDQSLVTQQEVESDTETELVWPEPGQVQVDFAEVARLETIEERLPSPIFQEEIATQLDTETNSTNSDST